MRPTRFSLVKFCHRVCINRIGELLRAVPEQSTAPNVLAMKVKKWTRVPSGSDDHSPTGASQMKTFFFFSERERENLVGNLVTSSPCISARTKQEKHETAMKCSGGEGKYFVKKLF